MGKISVICFRARVSITYRSLLAAGNGVIYRGFLIPAAARRDVTRP